MNQPESLNALQKRIAFVQQNYDQLCRFCGVETRGLFRIFVDSTPSVTTSAWTFNAERNIDQLLEKQYIKFNPGNELGLPNFICEKCVDSLVRWDRFLETFTATTKILLKVRDLLGIKSDPTIASEDDVSYEELEKESQEKVFPEGQDIYEIEYVHNLPENVTVEDVTIIETIDEEFELPLTEEIISDTKEESNESEQFIGFDELEEEKTFVHQKTISHKWKKRSSQNSEDSTSKVTTPQQCPICGVLVKVKMKHHLLRHSDPEGRPFKCSECDKAYSFKKTLLDHVRHVHQNVRYTCEVCQKQFVSRDVLRVHKKLHSNEQHHCQHCGQTFMQRVYLLKHMVVHEQKRFTCEDCGKTFRFKELMKQHARIHTGEKPYPCGMCDKSFRTSTHLKQHMRTHTQAKVFKCKLCPVAYANKKSLDRHVAGGQHHIEG